ncbi:hypothetical protein LguiB_012268 [Lonicera macranthoides]
MDNTQSTPANGLLEQISHQCVIYGLHIHTGESIRLIYLEEGVVVGCIEELKWSKLKGLGSSVWGSRNAAVWQNHSKAPVQVVNHASLLQAEWSSVQGIDLHQTPSNSSISSIDPVGSIGTATRWTKPPHVLFELMLSVKLFELILSMQSIRWFREQREPPISYSSSHLSASFLCLHPIFQRRPEPSTAVKKIVGTVA